MRSFSEFVQNKDAMIIAEIDNLISKNYTFRQIQIHLENKGIILSEITLGKLNESVLSGISHFASELGGGLYDITSGIATGIAGTFSGLAQTSMGLILGMIHLGVSLVTDDKSISYIAKNYIKEGLYTAAKSGILGTAKTLKGAARIIASPVAGTLKGIYDDSETIPVVRKTPDDEEIVTKRKTIAAPEEDKLEVHAPDQTSINGIKAVRTLMSKDIFGTMALNLDKEMISSEGDHIVMIAHTVLVEKLNQMQSRLSTIKSTEPEKYNLNKETWNRVGSAIRSMLKASKRKNGSRTIYTFKEFGETL